jgi:hypothetical protein
MPHLCLYYQIAYFLQRFIWEIRAILRDWIILYDGRRFYVNFTESDGQTLALCNRDNWEVQEETENGLEELCDCAFNSSTPEEHRQAEENARLKEKLIGFCIDQWDDEFMHEVQDKLVGQKGALEEMQSQA